MKNMKKIAAITCICISGAFGGIETVAMTVPAQYSIENVNPIKEKNGSAFIWVDQENFKHLEGVLVGGSEPVFPGAFMTEIRDINGKPLGTDKDNVITGVKAGDKILVQMKLYSTYKLLNNTGEKALVVSLTSPTGLKIRNSIQHQTFKNSDTLGGTKYLTFEITMPEGNLDLNKDLKWTFDLCELNAIPIAPEMANQPVLLGINRPKSSGGSSFVWMPNTQYPEIKEVIQNASDKKYINALTVEVRKYGQFLDSGADSMIEDFVAGDIVTLHLKLYKSYALGGQTGPNDLEVSISHPTITMITSQASQTFMGSDALGVSKDLILEFIMPAHPVNILNDLNWNFSIK